MQFLDHFIGTELVRVHMFWHRVGNLILNFIVKFLTN